MASEMKRARPRKLGVVLIERLPVIRAGLSLLVSAQPDMEILAEASSADQGLAAIGTLRRTNAVVLVDLELPGTRDAFWLIRALRERFPTMHVLAFGSSVDGNDISRALFVGADGFVNQTIEADQFLGALRRVVLGEPVLEGLPRDWLGRIADGLEQQWETPAILTERELEVLSISAEGLTARQIGNRLGVRERTVTTHLGRIYGKLGVGSRVAALSAATVAGLVTGSRPSA
jgi:DNA-binding NarL/FixJ family response regulator